MQRCCQGHLLDIRGFRRCDHDRAADICHAVNSHETYLELVQGSGWPVVDYKKWLYENLCQQLLALDEALAASELNDEMLAVGLFTPRGSSGGMMAGGLVGDVVGGGLGGVVGSALGDLAGMNAGRKIAGDIHNLPKDLIVGVSKEWVYGASMPGRKTPSILLFRVTRDGLGATTKDRLSVRILELQVPGDAEPIRLEGNRNPMTGAKSVISEVTA